MVTDEQKLILLSDEEEKLFSPSDLPSSVMPLWLDGADSSSMTIASNLVSQVNDKSGNGNNATATGTARPTYIPGVGLDFNGTTNFLTLTSTIADASEYEHFVVVTSDVLTGSRFYLGHTSGNSLEGRVTGNFAYRVVNGTSSDATQTYPFAAGARGIVNISRNPSNVVSVRFNGGSAVNLFSGAAQSGTENVTVIGVANSTFYWDGKISELIMLSRNATDLERANIINYLRTKWGI